MELERAIEINSGIMKTVMSSHVGPPYVPLPDVSLAELLEATAIIEANNKVVLPDGTSKMMFVCHPRGIAIHYAFKEFGRDIESMLNVVGLTLEPPEEDEDEPESEDG